jgi:putative acetyltransferase
MDYVYTDGKNKDFVMLCGMLDEYLNGSVGGEKQRAQYAQYNTLEHIRDVIIAYDGGTPAACASFKQYEEGVAEVKRVFVREEYRGRGISRDMMSLLEEKAKERGYSSLILETGAPLTAAIGLYKKLGYRVTENYGQYAVMKESVCMRKDL